MRAKNRTWPRRAKTRTVRLGRRLLVVGGHTRNIGKTALVVDIIRAFPGAEWSAVKITQGPRNVCPVHGAGCDCSPGEHPFSLEEEHGRSNRTDTSRFLVAGAARALWLRVRHSRMRDALPRLRRELRGAGNVIIESNTLLRFVRPRLYLFVLDPRETDFKASARRFLARADAFVSRAPLGWKMWRGVSPRAFECTPQFLHTPVRKLPSGLVAFIREQFFHSERFSVRNRRAFSIDRLRNR